MKSSEKMNVLERDTYRTPKKAEEARQQGLRPKWATPYVLLIVTLGSWGLDSITLFDILDAAMCQSECLGFIIAIGISFFLNVLPLPIALLTHQLIYRIKRGATVLLITLVMLFFLLYTFTFVLRFAYRDQYAKDNTTGQIMNELNVETTNQEEPEEGNARSIAVVLLMGIEPLVTSVLSFILSFLSCDVIEEQICYLHLRNKEIDEAEADLRAYLKSIENLELWFIRAAQQELICQSILRTLRRHHMCFLRSITTAHRHKSRLLLRK